jgi:3-hydroxybutyryl-CoA dehydratase
MRPVYPGDTITAQLEVTAIDTEKKFVTCSTDCVNQEGKTVLSGEATVLLDPKG